MLHSTTRDIVIKTTLEGNPEDTLAPGDRVAGLIHVSVLEDTQIKSLVVTSVGFEVAYGKRTLTLSHPFRSLAALAHIPPTVQDVKVFYARRTVVVEDTTMPCGAHTYSFRTRLPSVGLEPSLDTQQVGIHYGISAIVSLPSGLTISSQCSFRVGSMVGLGPRTAAGSLVRHGVLLGARAEMPNRADINVAVNAEPQRQIQRIQHTHNTQHTAEPRKMKAKFKRVTQMGQGTAASSSSADSPAESTIDTCSVPLSLNTTALAQLHTAPGGDKLVPSLPPGRASLFSISYHVKCRVSFGRRKVRRPSSAVLLLPVHVPDEARTTHMNGILGPDGIPVITQVAAAPHAMAGKEGGCRAVEGDEMMESGGGDDIGDDNADGDGGAGDGYFWH